MILVRAFPRVHVGLIDMGGVTPRRHGGAGFVLSEPVIEVSACRGAQRASGLLQLDDGARRDIRQLLKRIKADARFGPVTISIRKLPPQHIGLGTKTALLLAILKACELAWNHRVPSDDLQRMSGRGGVSGIGIHGFFHGGFLIDGGHRSTGDEPYIPSSYCRSFGLPPLHARTDIPPDWRFLLCYAPGRCCSGGTERAFFSRHCPIGKNDVLRTIAVVYHGVLPAVAEQDLIGLKASLTELHACGFKRHELENQSPDVQALYSSLNEIADCAVGMSSMGPLIFVIVRADDVYTRSLVYRRVRSGNASVLAATRGRNLGFEIA